MTITISDEQQIQSINIVFYPSGDVTKVVEGLNKQVGILQDAVNQ